MEPAIDWRFDLRPGYLDPRATFTRASLYGYRTNRAGRLVNMPANVMRPTFNAVTGRCNGIMIEAQRTNVLLWSQDFTNVAWGKTETTITPNVTAAPDGTMTAARLQVTTERPAATPEMSQGQSVGGAGRGVAVSIFAKVDKAPWLCLTVGDTTNSVRCWFNLKDGTTGTTTPGADTVLLSRAGTELLADGWVRCCLEVTTNTSSMFTFTVQPTFADGQEPSWLASAYVWGAQMEAEASTTRTSVSSYIPTTLFTTTRAADNLSIQADTRWYNPVEGTIVFEAQFGNLPPVLSQSMLLGGIGDTFSNTIYVTRNGSNSINVTARSTGGNAVIGRVMTLETGRIFRLAVAWGINDVAYTTDGGAMTTYSGAFGMGGATPRFAVGFAPFGSSATASVWNGNIRAFRYIPLRVPNASLQALTAFQ